MIVETPATRFSAMPKMMTSVALKPNDDGGEHAAEREDAGEPVAVHGARDAGTRRSGGARAKSATMSRTSST